VKRYPLFVFLAAVFAAKLIVVLQLRDHPLLQPGTGLDTTVYTELAARAVAGDWALGPGLYFVSPLYIYFLAGILAFAQSFTAARVVQILLGTAAVGLVFSAARAWFNTRAGWLAAILAALTGLFTFHEVLLLQAALDPFLTAAGLAALALAFEAETHGARRDARKARLWFVASGLAFGVQTLNRPNVLIPAALIAVLLLGRAVVRGGWRAAGGGLFMAAGLVLALAPVTIRNAVVAGDWSPASSHGGLNFYIGNNPEADGTYHGVPGITPNILGQQEDARRVAEAAVGRKLDDGDVSAYFYGLGWSWIQLHPGDAAALLARKLRFAVNAGYISLNYSYGAWRPVRAAPGGPVGWTRAVRVPGLALVRARIRARCRGLLRHRAVSPAAAGAHVRGCRRGVGSDLPPAHWFSWLPPSGGRTDAGHFDRPRRDHQLADAR